MTRNDGRDSVKKRIRFFPHLGGAVVVIIVFIAILVIFTLNTPGVIDTPPVILPSPVTGGATSVDSEEYGKHKDRVEIKVTAETVVAVISTLTRAADYSRVINVERFSGAKTSHTVINIWTRGQNSRIGINNGVTTKDILIKNDEIWIKYSDSPDFYYGHINDDRHIETDEYQSLITYEDIAKLAGSGVTDAGYVDYNGETCIFAEYISGNFGYRNLVYISVDTGLIMGNEMYDGGELIYRMSSDIPDISTPGDDVFIPPERQPA
ncbi:MAG: hypothetical protein FWG32_00220 [Oscillospiraceae bacterium]|nr:hypothetical protein [Oscillospiraceae bacterium]